MLCEPDPSFASEPTGWLADLLLSIVACLCLCIMRLRYCCWCFATVGISVWWLEKITAQLFADMCILLFEAYSNYFMSDFPSVYDVSMYLSLYTLDVYTDTRSVHLLSHSCSCMCARMYLQLMLHIRFICARWSLKMKQNKTKKNWKWLDRIQCIKGDVNCSNHIS